MQRHPPQQGGLPEPPPPDGATWQHLPSTSVTLEDIHQAIPPPSYEQVLKENRTAHQIELRLLDSAIQWLKHVRFINL